MPLARRDFFLSKKFCSAIIKVMKSILFIDGENLRRSVEEVLEVEKIDITNQTILLEILR